MRGYIFTYLAGIEYLYYSHPDLSWFSLQTLQTIPIVLGTPSCFYKGYLILYRDFRTSNFRGLLMGSLERSTHTKSAYFLSLNFLLDKILYYYCMDI